MNIRTTTDPISLRDVTVSQNGPCIYEGDGENGVEIYFESDQTRNDYMKILPHDPKILMGKDSEDYVAEG